MNMKPLTTASEFVIKEAAKQEFMTMGFVGARMTSIAKKARVTTALLHYYFRSKENLFEITCAEAMNSIFEAINKALKGTNKDIFSKIETIVNNYIDFNIKSPKLLMFVLNEFSHNPDRMKNLSAKLKTSESFAVFAGQIEAGKKAGIINQEVNPQNVFTDILSLCFFQFTAEPFLASAFEFGENDYPKFIENRKSAITNTIISSIKQTSIKQK